MPPIDRATCPACGRYRPTRRERAGETSPLYTIVNRDGSAGLCWGEPGREFLCPTALPPADPALRTAGLAVAEREAELRRLVGERDEARDLSCVLHAVIGQVFGPWPAKAGDFWFTRDEKGFDTFHTDEADATKAVAATCKRLYEKSKLAADLAGAKEGGGG